MDGSVRWDVVVNDLILARRCRAGAVHPITSSFTPGMCICGHHRLAGGLELRLRYNRLEYGVYSLVDAIAGWKAGSAGHGRCPKSKRPRQSRRGRFWREVLPHKTAYLVAPI